MKEKDWKFLDDIEIASPCSADWENMKGDERRRFCQTCQLNVYNLSSMTRREAEKFIFEAEGQKCVQFFRRKDGTILTNDCPAALRIIRSSFLKVKLSIGNKA